MAPPDDWGRGRPGCARRFCGERMAGAGKRQAARADCSGSVPWAAGLARVVLQSPGQFDWPRTLGDVMRRILVIAVALVLVSGEAHAQVGNLIWEDDFNS